nr:MAG TPA: hypothetical protein [Caudoviricetes sp.]
MNAYLHFKTIKRRTDVQHFAPPFKPNKTNLQLGLFITNITISFTGIAFYVIFF